MSILTAYDKFIQQALKYGFSLFGTPKTGQTTSYRTGDDGTYQKGYPKDPPRFKDNDDGTITDNATGLMWVKDISQLGPPFTDGGDPDWMHWDPAIDACLALDYAGHTDWRLPNAMELASVLDMSAPAPVHMDLDFFVCPPQSFWTSTTDAELTTNAFGIYFPDASFLSAAKSGYLMARPVRLGRPAD